MNFLGTLHVNEKGLEVSEHGTRYSEGQQVVFIDKSVPGAWLPGGSYRPATLTGCSASPRLSLLICKMGIGAVSLTGR